MGTIEINGGRRDKLRPGDLLGAVTASGEIPGSAVGKIDVLETKTFIAIDKRNVSRVVEILNASPIKGKPFRARSLHGAGRRPTPWEVASHSSSKG